MPIALTPWTGELGPDSKLTWRRPSGCHQRRVTTQPRRAFTPIVTRFAVLVPFLAAAALFLPACSSSPAICTALESGQDPLTASRTAYGDAGGDPATAARMLRQGATEVRASCPDRAADASQLESMAGVVEIGS